MHIEWLLHILCRFDTAQTRQASKWILQRFCAIPFYFSTTYIWLMPFGIKSVSVRVCVCVCVCAKIANSFQFPNHMAVTHSMPSLKLIFAWNYFWSLQLTGSWISANKLLWINKIDLQHVVVKGQGLYTCGALYGTPKKHVNQCCFKYFSIKLHLIPSIPFIPNEITSIPRCQAHLFIRNLKMTQPFFQRNLI